MITFDFSLYFKLIDGISAVIVTLFLFFGLWLWDRRVFPFTCRRFFSVVFVLGALYSLFRHLVVIANSP